MLLENPHDPIAWTIEDQFLLGTDLLVAPVLDRGADSRMVQLPRPGTWIDLWRGTRHAGGSRFRVTAPVGVIPLFLRARSVLATLDTRVDTLVRRAAGVTGRLHTLDDAERSLSFTIGPDFTGPAQLYDGTRIWWAGERRSAPLEAPPAEEPHALLPERMLGSWRRIGAGVGRAGTIACGRRWLAVESPIERRFTIWTPGR
jgi:glycosyl hydrolase family 31